MHMKSLACPLSKHPQSLLSDPKKIHGSLERKISLLFLAAVPTDDDTRVFSFRIRLYNKTTLAQEMEEGQNGSEMGNSHPAAPSLTAAIPQ